MTSGGWSKGFRGARRISSTLAALSALAVCANAASAGAFTPSPDDWRDVVIYQVITDRFENGDPSNDAVEGAYAPSDGFRIHGGDFAGIEQRLDYLVNLGVNAIWISPVPLNANAEYHGYAARDLYAIAPHFGTLAELQSMVAAAHARGIYVIMDFVVNHMGDLIDSGDPGYPNFKYPATYTLRWRNPSKRFYGAFDDLSMFHAHGNVGDFSDPEQILGELFGLDDLKTELPAVQAELAAAAQWLIANTDCDAFRLDTVKHVDMGFWDAWCPAVHGYATGLGKDAFFLFGEVYDGDDGKNGSYTGTVSGGNYKLDSVLHFPMYFTTTGVFGFDNTPQWIADRYAGLGAYDPTSRERLVTFLDNHDNARFLSFGIANQDEGKLRTALGWLLTSRGVPAIYYGTEQEFDVGGDPYNREDMWDGAWDFGPSEGDNFDLAHPLFRYTRRLLALRRRHEALRRGTTTEHFVEPGSAGLYLYERRSATDTVLVAVNNSNAPITRTGEPVPWPAGTALRDAMAPVESALTVDGAGHVTLRVPARGIVVLESRAAWQAAAPARRLGVEAMFPGHDQRLNDRYSPLQVRFDAPLDPASTTGAFTITPPVSGSLTVNSHVLRFTPDAPWAAGNYRWSLAASLASTAGDTLPAPVEATFRIESYATGLIVPTGVAVDLVARQGLQAPEGLVRGGKLGPETMLLSDVGRNRLFTVTSGGDLGRWMSDSRWTKPEGVAAAPRGFGVADAGGLFTVDSLGITRRLSFGTNATATGALVHDTGGGPYPAGFFLCDPVADRIMCYDDAGGTLVFANGIKGGEGIAFGPGGDWGTELYVADANLTSIGTDADGEGRIVRVGPTGTVTTVALDATALGGASAIAFDHVGRFGGDLFVANILNERIYRVKPDGTVLPFASGFQNLSGSHCIAFGDDGALYVADPGSNQPFSNTIGTSQRSVWRFAAQESVADVPEGIVDRLALRAPSPNPASATTAFAIELPRGGATSLVLYDLAGRRVRTLFDGVLDAGAHPVVWNLTDEDGRAVRAGLYMARCEWEGRVVTRRVAVVK